MSSQQKTGMPLYGIQEALRFGCKLRAFMSGTGPCVVRLEYHGMLRGYGEHPHMEEALERCSRAYRSLPPRETEPFVSCPIPSDKLDAWIWRGGTLHCQQDGDEVICCLAGFSASPIITGDSWRSNRIAYVERAAYVLTAISRAVSAAQKDGEL